ncbi:hypothetical protein ARAM_002728 [Aspergillus rambellii]|uniref:Uncharacterized protein n=3 Tax=Aspergillus subgen. Nidulantes TaxID=2720870 RepID=A0A0F8UGP8_9EURO|nr:hypothetical protein ARAM_002728 [Aspergillus rambellii]
MSNGNTSQPAVGDKREREAAAPSTAPDKPSTDDPLEPSPKKQRTGEDNSEIAHGSSSSPVPTATEKPSEVSNGEKKKKKKGGRPKKTNDAINRNIPADGIGSRTRSRTKVVS